MSIYTKKGDRGKTSLYSSPRENKRGLYGEKRKRAKDNQRIVAYGTVDELNSQLGLVSSFLSDRKLKSLVKDIQKDLFEIASELATPPRKKSPFEFGTKRVRELEKLIDELEGKLPVLANFIFPGGSPGGAALHVARSVGRRAEREVVRLSRKEKVNPNILIYLNRLSDALFMLARWANRLAKKPEETWKGK